MGSQPDVEYNGQRTMLSTSRCNKLNVRPSQYSLPIKS